MNNYFKSPPFLTKILNVQQKPGSTFKSNWKSDMLEIEITDGRKFISDFRTNFELLRNKDVMVYSESSKAPGWEWLHLCNEQTTNLAKNDWGPHSLLRLDRINYNELPKKKCYIYKMTIGANIYIGFTTKNPNTREQEHKTSAQSGSMQLIHKELRKWGLNYLFEVLGEYENEVHALLDEIKFIQKYNARLNSSNGGEGNQFRIIESKNEFDEYVFFVSKEF